LTGWVPFAKKMAHPTLTAVRARSPEEDHDDDETLDAPRLRPRGGGRARRHASRRCPGPDQDRGIRVFPELTALENLLVVATGDYADAERRALELLGWVKLEALAREYASNLSYGQQKLVEFVRVLMADPELILLDEPVAGVNRTLLNELLDAVRALRDRGKTVLLVEHVMKVVMGLCETVFVLDHGEKLAEGPPGVIQSDEGVVEGYFGR